MTRAHEPASGDDDRISLRDWYALIQRRKLLIAGTALLAFATGTVAIMKLPNRFTAEALVLVDAPREQTGELQSLIPRTQVEPSVIRSEIDIITSPVVAERVAAKLGPAGDRRCRSEGSERPTAAFWPWLVPESVSAAVGDRLKAVGNFGGQAAPRSTLDELWEGLTVANDGRSSVIRIRYEACDPEVARDFANAFANAYLEQHVTVKAAIAARVEEWLSTQINSLRQQVEEAENAVASYKQEHGLIQGRGGETIALQQAAELNSQLILAQVARSEKEARLAALHSVDATSPRDAVAAVLASPTIEHLRQEEVAITQREEELRVSYLPRHPELVAVRAMRAEVARKIEAEIQRITRGMENELVEARAREISLQGAVNRAEEAASSNSKAGVRLGELERKSEASRTLIKEMLARVGQTRADQKLITPDARLVSAAMLPLTPSFPRRKLLLGLLATVSVGGAIGVAFMREHGRTGVRSESELQHLLGVPVLGLTPRMATRRWRPRSTALSREIHKTAVESIRSALRGPAARLDPKLILITSSLPAEGKTTLATHLAASISSSSSRCLLINCDFRRPAVVERLQDRRRRKLIPVDGESSLRCGYLHDGPGRLMRDPVSGLDILVTRSAVRNPLDVLESARFRELLVAACSAYDTVLLDGPPALSVADASVLSKYVDLTILVVRWETTAKNFVSHALNSLRPKRVDGVVAVLTQVDLKKHALYRFGDRGYCLFHYGSSYVSRQETS